MQVRSACFLVGIGFYIQFWTDSFSQNVRARSRKFFILAQNQKNQQLFTQQGVAGDDSRRRHVTALSLPPRFRSCGLLVTHSDADQPAGVQHRIPRSPLFFFSACSAPGRKSVLTFCSLNELYLEK